MLVLLCNLDRWKKKCALSSDESKTDVIDDEDLSQLLVSLCSLLSDSLYEKTH